jgi:hypothetical protein
MSHNGRGGENINGLGPLNLSVWHLFEGHENQNFNENPKFKHGKPSLVHPSIPISFQLFGGINVNDETLPFQDISGPKQLENNNSRGFT